MPSQRELIAALRDPVKFAEALCGAPLWEHQVQVARSKARYRAICAGRQCGKSRLLAVLSLHTAFTAPGATVLIVSAGESAAQRVLAEIASLASSPLLSPSVTDETKGRVVLSNGSQILSVPASQRQIRGWPVNLLIMDEAGFIDPEIWRAAEPAIIARPGSKVIMVSSPWGDATHFFRALWQRGMDQPDVMYQAWHWPSSISPLVDQNLLDEIRRREGEAFFRREFLAEWTDVAGQFLTEEEISSAVASYELAPPERVLSWSPWDRWTERRELPYTAVAGVDWGFARDANALVLVAALDDGCLNGGREHRYYIPWMTAQYRVPYAQWVSTCASAATGYGIRAYASEENGVGAAPTQMLQSEIIQRGLGSFVAGVWTDARRKQSGFGMIKMMLQRQQLVLPSEPDLLRELRALEFEQLPGGSVKISVPEKAGHDDLAMALMQAVSCLRPSLRMQDEVPERHGLEHTVTAGGIKVPMQPRPVEWHSASYGPPAGKEPRPESGW